jgi:hypothetical protein
LFSLFCLFAKSLNQLVIAQEQRVKTSQAQAFWWGFGWGNGVEASELAKVRGEEEAVQRTMKTSLLLYKLCMRKHFSIF